MFVGIDSYLGAYWPASWLENETEWPSVCMLGSLQDCLPGPRGSGLKAEELIVKDPANPGNGRSWLAFIGTSDGVYLTKHLGNPHGASVLSNSLLADNVYQYRESVFPTRQAAHQERGSAHFYMPWMSFGNFRQRILADALVSGA